MRGIWLSLLTLVALPAWAVEPLHWTLKAPEATYSPTGGLCWGEDDRYGIDPDAVGKPALPSRTCLVAVPDGAVVTSLTWSVTWSTLAETAYVPPVSEPVRIGDSPAPAIEDAAVYQGNAAYPAEAVRRGAEERMCGVRILSVGVSPFRWHPASGRLERAERLAITVGFAEGGERSYVMAPGMWASVRDAVVNPAAVTLATAASPVVARPGSATRLRATKAAGETAAQVDYLLLSPPDFVADWNWYVEARRKVHAGVTFRVKDTAEIYAEYPFGGTNHCRNAAESIHAYLRANRESMKFSYVVLGGAWLDAQNRKGTKPVFYGGESMSLSNCVPGVYGYPRENWREIPSDMFYACLDIPDTQANPYPWDSNGDGVYIDQDDCSKNDLKPDVCVTRITLNPYRPNSLPAYNRHALVTNYVAKLARGEDPRFYGHFRYGLSPDSTGSRRLRANGDRMYYDELEFYDNMYNMADPRHSKYIEDNEVEPRRRIKCQFAQWRPVLEAKGMMNYTWTKGFATLADAINDYYASDRDYGFVYSHGWAQGATHFQAYRFATGGGLTILNGSNGPCDTGYVDYHVTMGGVPTLQYNLGDSGVTNPDGGALASINNTRWGWAGGSHTGIDFDSSMSYFMLNRSLVGFNQLYLDVGHAWFKGVSDYASFGFTQGGGTHTWTLTEQICYGDPLVRLPAPEDRWWCGGATGVWDQVTSNWSNAVDSAVEFYPASNVYFRAELASEITVATNVGALRLSVPIVTNGTCSFVGAAGGQLRVMKKIDVAGGDLHLNVAGGVGHDGIEFFRTEGMDRAGELVFAGTNRFYVAKVTGASRIRLCGGNVVLDADNFPADGLPLVFDGPGKDALGEPNELRSYRAGGLCRFGALAITNSQVKLATADAFGRGDVPTDIDLVGSRLEIAANAFYERKGCYQANGYSENLNADVAVGGESEVTSSPGGLWTVAKVTSFHLFPGASLKLSATTRDCGGKIVIDGTGTVEVASAAALAGQVEVGGGIRLILDELPLASVTSLKIADGAAVVLPNEKSGYWQILPVSSHLEAGEVTFHAVGAPADALEGTASPSGAFFKQGALYEWELPDGHWSESLARRHPKLLFGDLAGADSVTVRVDLAVSPDFVSFANGQTRYRFTAAAEDAGIAFDNIILNGDTTFDLPVSASVYVEVLGGTAGFAEVVAPTVRIGRQASLTLMGSHWTRFILEDGAKLVALPGCQLDWNTETDFEFEGTGPVAIDVSALELTREPQVLIAGGGRVWTAADLVNFTTVGQWAELRVVNGALAVVGGENLKGFYRLEFADSTNWNQRGWTYAGTNATPFARIWSECVLDWASDIRLAPPPALAGASADALTLTVDSPVVANCVTVEPTANRLVLAATVPANRFEVASVDCQSCLGGVEFELATGAAAIICPTNENATTVFRQPGTGLITFTDGTLELHAFGGWTLAAGAQGTIRLVAPAGWQKFRVAAVASGFQLDSNVMEVTDRDGHRIDGYAFAVQDGVLWCTPSGVRAVVPAGTNEWSDLSWQDPMGNPTSGVDWRAVKGITLVGEPGCAVSATNGFAGVLDRLSAEGTVRLVGELTWTPTRLPTQGDLVLDGGFKVKVNLQSRPRLLDGARLGFADDATLEISHGGATANMSDQNWSGLFGTGRFLHLNGNAANWLAWPAKGPQGDFTVYNGADVVLTEQVSAAAPFAVRNLSGPAGFRTDWGGGSMLRPVRTVQTRVSEFAGVFAGISSSRDSKLCVASDAPVPTVEKALILSGDNSNRHVLEIETNGCVILTGTWKGTINVRGLLVVTNAAVLASGVQVNYFVSPAEPLVTNAVPAAPAFDFGDPPEVSTVAPELVVPEEPEAPPVRIDVADPTTNVTAFAGIVRLLDDVRLTVRGLPAFTLATDSVGRVEVRLTEAPTVDGTVLVRTESGFAPSDAVTVTLRDRFGNAFLAPVSVVWKEGGYVAYVQNLSAPAYRHTFDGSVVNPNYNATDLAETTDSKYFIPSRDGQAIVNYYCGSRNGWNLMSPFPTAWTVNMVAKLPTNRGGVLFGFGYGGYCAKGFAFIGDGTDRAALVVWRNWNVTARLSVEVPLSTTQFHVYTATYDGAVLRFYVDGELGAALADTEGFQASNGWCYQFWGLCSGTYPGGLGGASGGAVDDWSFYRFTATPESVRYLAAQFPVWPECREANIVEPEQDLAALEWSESGDATLPYLLVGNGGSLKLDGDLTFDTPIRSSGDAMTLKLGPEGRLTVKGGLAAQAAITVDVSAIDGTNLAANAVCGVPYSRWLVRGAVSGTVTVTGVPSVPHGYAIEPVCEAAHGVRLVVTAPWFAKYRSLSFNFAGGDKVANATASRVSDQAEVKDLKHGAHPVIGTDWYDLEAKNHSVTAKGVEVTVSQVKNAYCTMTSVGDRILYGYVDDGYNPTVTVGQIPYAKFRIVAYAATDTGNVYFAPVWMGASSADAVRHYGPTCNDASGGYTVSGWSDVTWGDSDVRGQLTEGVNYVVSDVITGAVGAATAYIRLDRLAAATAARACLAGFQIVEVGEVFESAAVDYRAEVTNTTEWADGDGGGLDHAVAWQNDVNSLITLVAPSSGCPKVTFDTAVTAGVLKVESRVGERLGLDWNGNAPLAVESVDLKDARGETVLATNWFGNLPVETSAGTRLRFTAAATEPQFTAAGAIVAYREATFATSLTPVNWILRTEEPVDCVSLYGAGTAYQYVPIDVSGGTFVYTAGGKTECYYGGNRNTSATNSVLTVNAGTFVCDVTGMQKSGSGRGFIIGVTGEAKTVPKVVVNGGVFDCSLGQLTPWEYGTVIQNGGLMKVRGIYKGGGRAGALAFNGGIAEIGDGGIGQSAAKMLPTTLAGGTLRAVDDAQVTLPVTLSRRSAVAATNGTSLVFTQAVTGGGGLSVGATNWTGRVVFENAACALGAVHLVAGTLSVPFGAVSGDLQVEAGAILDLAFTGNFTEERYDLCGGTLTLAAGATVTLNGSPLPEWCRVDGNALAVTTEAHRWANPVTGESVHFAYRFTGRISGDWQVADNWEIYTVNAWQALTGTKYPMLPDHGMFDATVIDGSFLTNVANRTVELKATMEGWTPRLAVLNAATVTVDTVKKFQGTPKWLWVGAGSQLKVNGFGTGSYQDAIQFYVAGSNGLVFAQDPGGDDATFEYHFKGRGTVDYRSALTKCRHRIVRADFTLSASGAGKAVRRQLLVSFPTDSTVEFTTAGATVSVNDPADELEAATLRTAITDRDAIGAYVITQRLDGVWLDYVDRAESANYVHEFDYSNEVRQVAIPVDWLMQLTNCANVGLSARDLTPAKLAAALESTATANGMRAWESYVLGLEPTNAADRIEANLKRENGKLRIEARGLETDRFRAGVRVKYLLQATDDLAQPFATIREAQDGESFDDLTSESPAQFYRVRVDLHW